MHALLEAKNLSCGYQGQTIFSDLNFTLNQGQFAGIVGPSGSGKTTFIKSLLGLIHPFQGTISFRGKPIHGANWTRSGTRKASRKVGGPKVSGPKIGYVPQVETVDWNFPVTAAEVVMMGRYRRRHLWPWPSQQDRATAQRLLERVGAAEVAHRAIGELSGGQQQRVFLARALVGNPDLVLLDEPTSSADVQTQHELLHLLWDLNDQGVSILLSTHDLNSVATHLPWVVCFNHGIVDQGRPLDVLTTETLAQTFGGDMVVQTQGDRVLIANRATAIRHPVQRPRPALLPPQTLPPQTVEPQTVETNHRQKAAAAPHTAHHATDYRNSDYPEANYRQVNAAPGVDSPHLNHLEKNEAHSSAHKSEVHNSAYGESEGDRFSQPSHSFQSPPSHPIDHHRQ